MLPGNHRAGFVCTASTLAMLWAGCGYPHPAALDAGDDQQVVDGDRPDAPIDALEGCVCGGTTLTCASIAPISCATTCLNTPTPHCEQLIPSNTVDPDLLAPVNAKITITAATAIDSGTGAISGGITRAAGQGVNAGIGYTQVGSLGVFTFDDLEVAAGQTLRVFGTRPAVFLVRKTVRVTGIIDASANQTARTQGGPGGGTGGSGTSVATGCGPGGAGNSDSISDSGGGGGGGGALAGKGGKAAAANGGTGGASCIPLTLEPLVGGSGGGKGSKGTAAESPGGGGGGALQISALTQIIVDGTIDVGGAGGTAGQPDGSGTMMNAGAGGGGGSGGALLLEAPVVMVNTGAVLAVNGGGGGGAANSGDAGTTGTDGQRSASVATGGPAASSGGTKGGNGGAGATAPQNGTDTSNTTYNTGGGGGAVGVIFIRAKTTPTLAGTVSPGATTGAYRAD